MHDDDSITFEIRCSVCDSYCEVYVVDSEHPELPAYCPMCGSDVVAE